MAKPALHARNAPENPPIDPRAEGLFRRANDISMPSMLLAAHLESDAERIGFIGDRLRMLGYAAESSARDPDMDGFASQILRLTAETLWDLATCAQGIDEGKEASRQKIEMAHAALAASVEIRDAWEAFCSAYLIAHPVTGSPSRRAIEHAERGMELNDESFAHTSTRSIPDVVIKLKRVLVHRERGGPIARALAANDITDETRRGIEMIDLYDRILWSAIEDLEAIAQTC